MNPIRHPILETFRTAIFDTIPDALLVLSSDLIVLSVNEAFYQHFQVNPKDTINRSIFDIGNKQWDIPQLRTLLYKILPEKKVIEGFEVTHNFPTIGNRTIVINAKEIRSSEFLPMDLILVIFIDITDRKKWTESVLELNNQLQKVNCDLQRYGHSLSHDLRAPVNMILGFSKIILEELDSGSCESIRDYLNRIIHNADNMNKMIDGLSQLAGIASTSFSKYYVSLSDIADRVIADLKIEDPEREIEVNIERDMIDVVEPSMMLIALTNLLNNSWKFTCGRKPAKIRFGFKKTNDKKTYFIEDNGVGFNMSSAGKLFGMFQRLHSDQKFKGTGTGLAIVKSIIEKHNGEVWAESEEGKGTTIFFTIGSL